VFILGEAQAYRSSAGVIRRFCPRCGTALTYESARRPDTIDVATVALDDPNAFPPTGEVWVAHRIAWEAPNPALAQFSTGGD
jgi:hypothetical protein